MGSWSTLSKVPRAIRSGVVFEAVALVEFSFDFCRGHRLSWSSGNVGALDDYLVSIRVELCVGCFRG